MFEVLQVPQTAAQQSQNWYPKNDVQEIVSTHWLQGKDAVVMNEINNDHCS